MFRKTLFDRSIKKYAFEDVESIFSDLSSGSDGLSDESIDMMREKYGENIFDKKREDTFLFRLRKAFINPFNIILFILAVVSFATDNLIVSNFSKNKSTSFIIAVMIILSGGIRFVQEIRAKNAADKLNMMVDDKIIVKRNGKKISIPSHDIVVGDIVYLSAGDFVPADIRLIEATDLFVSQAVITGESNVVEKSSNTLPRDFDKAVTNLSNLLFMGTAVISGKGKGIVLSVGKDTIYGNFSKFNSEKNELFYKGANSIAWVMIRFMAVLIPIVFVLLWMTGGNWIASLGFSLSVSVGLIPEMLPMVITACLAKGSLTMSRKNTIIKNINAMQVFGSMDVLCMDKTGTLTNESILLEYFMDVLGNESSKVLDYAFLNSSYHSGVRNPIDNAVLACETMPNRQAYYENLLEKYKKIDEFPFDYFRKVVSTLVENNQGEYELIVKGEVDSVVSMCKYIEYKNEIIEIKEEEKNGASLVVDEMLNDGMKVIAVARKNVDSEYKFIKEGEQDLILLGYIAFFDAPKSTAKESISRLKQLNVIPKVMTGDDSKVAVSICKRVGIYADEVLCGSMMDKMSDKEIMEILDKVHVFSELTPSQKARLVFLLKEKGHRVGFLGDGINDIPAMNEAHVGISVDTAVDAAKDAADVILLQKDLNVLEEGILEGRRTFVNMLKYIKITASSNLGNILAVVCASAFLPFLPMTAIQILMLNLLYDALCIVLPWDNVDSDELLKAKEWTGKKLNRFMISFGSVSLLFDIITFVVLYFVICPLVCGNVYNNITDPIIQNKFISIFQTGWFLESMWTQVLILHFLRTSKIPFLQSRPSYPVIFITLFGVGMFTFMTFTENLDIIGLTRMPNLYFGFLLCIVLMYMVLTTLCKFIYQKKYGQLI